MTFLLMILLIQTEIPSGKKAGERMEMTLPGGAVIAFRWCPPGTFTMGAPPEETKEDKYTWRFEEHPRKVKLTKGFWVSETECTKAQTDGFIPAKPDEGLSGNILHIKRELAELKQFQAMEKDPKRKKQLEQHLKDGKAELARLEQMHASPQADPNANHPQQFRWAQWWQKLQELNKVSQLNGWEYRFATSAEWEYACRAGTKTPYAGNLADMGWYSENTPITKRQYKNWDGKMRTETFQNPQAVATKAPNTWGLYDMHGNAAEWVMDWYHPGSDDETFFKSVNTSSIDPTGPIIGVEYITKPHLPPRAEELSPKVRNALKKELETALKRFTLTMEKPNALMYVQTWGLTLHKMMRGGHSKSQPKECRSAASQKAENNEQFAGLRLVLAPTRKGGWGKQPSL